MTGRKGRRVKSLPRVVADVDPVIRSHMEMRLRYIEEVACGSQVSGTGALGKEEATKGILRSLGGDWKADAEAIVECHRAEVMEWWQDFPERQLLTDLYRRASRRRAGCGSPDSRRRPSHEEGLRVARALLADIADMGRLDSEWEFAAVSKMMAALLLPPLGVCSRGGLRQYIQCSRSSRVHFDALERIWEEVDSRGEGISRPLLRWRRCPARKPIQSHRPVNPAKLLHDVQIQFAIEILRRVGVPPTGSPVSVSGCLIVSEALGRLGPSEETVKRIWREYKGPFALVMRKYWKATAERAGLSKYHTKA